MFYDKYVEIIEQLVKEMQSGEGLDNLFEARIFEIVFKVDVPIRKAVKYRNNIIKSHMTSTNLPYASGYFYNKLFNNKNEAVTTETIIKIFTHLLCEEKIVLIADDTQELIPIWIALHSLIYPFRYANATPYTRDDGNDDDENEMAGICPPMPFFNGIVKRDKALAMKIIEYEDYTSPLFIDLTEKTPDKQFHTLIRRNTQSTSNNGVV